MTKKQKVWLGIFLGMFIVPEVLFSFLMSSIASLLGKNFPFFYSLFINPQFFVDHPTYLFFALAIEWLGVFGLLIWNFKFKNVKKITIPLLTILIWLSFIFYLGYAITNINFP